MKKTFLKVPYIDLPSKYRKEKTELSIVFEEIASSGQFILREQVRTFEHEISKYLGVKYVVGLNSGTDALFLSLKAMGIKEGDEVITVSHTFVATISTIVHCGATPILVDIKEDGNIDISQIEKVITHKTKAIVVVHMNGKVCDMNEVLDLAKKFKIEILEDAAQAFGAKYKNKFAGLFGTCAAFSLHPMKVFGCMGDGGFVTTNDEEMYNKLVLLRNHGQLTKDEIVLFGYSSRLDNLQAAILLYRLKSFEQEIKNRREVAKFYISNLNNLREVTLPKMDENDRRDIFSSFVIIAKDRNRLSKFLTASGIEVYSHWNTPNHKQENLNLGHFYLPKTETHSKNVLSLPLHSDLNKEQLTYTVNKILEFYDAK